MTFIDQLASDIEKEISSRYCYFSSGAKADMRSMIVAKLRGVVPEPQQSLTFEDEKKNAAQSGAILALLKERRAEGATNVELADLSLKYTSRTSDLRKQGYRIDCTREDGRIHRYRLYPTDW